MAFVAVARRADVAAGSAVPRIAVKGHTQVAAGIRLTDALAALAPHPQQALQATYAAVITIRLGIEEAVTVAATTHIVIDTASAAATTVIIIIAVEVDKTLAIAVVFIGVAAHAFAATNILGVRGSHAREIVAGLSKGYPTERSRHDGGVKRSGHFASRSLKRMGEPQVFVGVRVRHAAEEVGITLLPIQPGTIVVAKVVLVATQAKDILRHDLVHRARSAAVRLLRPGVWSRDRQQIKRARQTTRVEPALQVIDASVQELTPFRPCRGVSSAGSQSRSLR